jgi:hypothetical protein
MGEHDVTPPAPPLAHPDEEPVPTPRSPRGTILSAEAQLAAARAELAEERRAHSATRATLVATEVSRDAAVAELARYYERALHHYGERVPTIDVAPTLPATPGAPRTPAPMISVIPPKAADSIAAIDTKTSVIETTVSQQPTRAESRRYALLIALVVTLGQFFSWLATKH